MFAHGQYAFQRWRQAEVCESMKFTYRVEIVQWKCGQAAWLKIFCVKWRWGCALQFLNWLDSGVIKKKIALKKGFRCTNDCKTMHTSSCAMLFWGLLKLKGLFYSSQVCSVSLVNIHVRQLQWHTQKNFTGEFHSMACGSFLYLVRAVCDVTI